MRKFAIIQMSYFPTECLSCFILITFGEKFRLPICGRCLFPFCCFPFLLRAKLDSILTLVEEFIRSRLATALREPVLRRCLPFRLHLQVNRLL